MMGPLDMLGLFFVVLGVLSVFKIQQKKELANRLAKRFCEQHRLQLLDGTVAFQGLHFTRPKYLIALRFQFEYSANNTDRFPGGISLVGSKVQAFHIDQAHIEAEER